MDTTDRGADEAVIEVPLSQDRTLDMLCNVRRRHAIRHLLANERTTLSEVVDRVTAAERDGDPEEIPRNERKSVYVSLYQHHLPRLEDAGWVRFDRDEGRVELTDEFRSSQLQPARGPAVETAGEGRERPDGSDPVRSAPRSDDGSPGTGSTDEGTTDGGTNPREAAASNWKWVPYYASLCCSYWILALVDVLNLVAYEFVTTSEWIFAFLLLFSLLVLFHIRDNGAIEGGAFRGTGSR